MNYAFLFPGQGAQYVGMGNDLYKEHDCVKKLFQFAGKITGKNMTELIFDSSEEELQRTDNAQLAITLINIAVAEVLAQRGIKPSIVAGFSLGEYASLVVSGIVKFEDIFELVRVRGQIMDEAKLQIESLHKEEGPVGMTAILGLSPIEIQKYLDEWQLPNVFLSMYNSPIQGVIGGTESARGKAIEKLTECGAKKIVALKVAGPFHTPLMKEASEKFKRAIENIPFHDPHIPVFSNVHGSPVSSGDEMKSLCVEQLISPVRWIDEEEQVWKHTPDVLIEAGVGNVLTGLWKAWKKNHKDSEDIPNCNPAGTVELIRGLEE